MRLITTLALVTTALAGAAGAEPLRDLALETFKPLPSTTPSKADNPVTPEKIELGKALFFDPRLSASRVFSCYSCPNRPRLAEGPAQRTDRAERCSERSAVLGRPRR